MNIPKAIEILHDLNLFSVYVFSPDEKDALQLGREALKQIKWLHESQVLHDDELLPGETEN